MEKLVSVIIPCFNAQDWLKEAINSCLQQTYSKIEIIVIDDGSTDQSLEVIKSFRDKVVWETGPNRGGNYARNRGFILSQGEYIQFLDADDYLLPEKIEEQVCFLKKTGADIAYSDWRIKRHLPDGTSFLEAIKVSGPREDFLESLLTDERWIPPVAILFTRAAVIRSGKWDEKVKAAQDRDFLLSAVIDGVRISYQPGCYSIYRRYGKTTVSTRNKPLWLESHFSIMEKAENKLTQLSKLSQKYQKALAKGYFSKFRHGYEYLSYSENLWVLKKVLALDPEFNVSGSKIYDFIQAVLGKRILGFLIAQYIINFRKKTQKRFFYIYKDS